MNVSLTKEQEKMIREKVESGAYSCASEVIREALSLFQDREDLRRVRLERLRKEIDIGLKQYERGECGPLDAKALKAKLNAEFKAERAANRKAQ